MSDEFVGVSIAEYEEMFGKIPEKNRKLCEVLVMLSIFVTDEQFQQILDIVTGEEGAPK